MKLANRWVRMLVFGILLYIAWRLGTGVFELYSAGGELEEAKEELSQAQTEKEELEARWEQVGSDEYKEKVARDELLMQKEGEAVILVSEPELGMSGDRVNEAENGKNWQKWLALFVY